MMITTAPTIFGFHSGFPAIPSHSLTPDRFFEAAIHDLLSSNVIDCKTQPRSNSTQPFHTVRPSHIIKTEESGCSLEVELPGVTKDHLHIQVDGDRILRITADRFRAAVMKKKGFKSALNTDDNVATGGESQLQDPEDGNKTSAQGSVASMEAEAMDESNDSVYNHDHDDVLSTRYELSIKLSTKVDTEAVTVTHLQDGMLSMNLPFEKSVGPRMVPIA